MTQLSFLFATTQAYYYQEGGGSPAWFSLAPILVFFAVFYFLVLRPQLKQQKSHRSMINNLKKGDKVITSGGIWGEIDQVDEKTVRLKISDKNKIMVSRSAISGFQANPEAAAPGNAGK